VSKTQHNINRVYQQAPSCGPPAESKGGVQMGSFGNKSFAWVAHPAVAGSGN
jgi:hypothetical protein